MNSARVSDVGYPVPLEWVGITSVYPLDATLVTLFTEACRRWGHLPAVAGIGETGELTYNDLDRKSSQAAHRLIAMGVCPGHLVGLYMQRSAHALIAMLAIIKAGAAYVPLDPGYPPERLRFMAEDAHLQVILVSHGTLPTSLTQFCTVCDLEDATRPLEVERSDCPNVSQSSLSLAYVMYTSGSTGVPKGVEITHRGIVRLVLGQDYVQLGRSCRMLHAAPISFDAATFEIWGPLLTGGCIIPLPEERLSLTSLAAAITDHGITTVWLTAGLFHAMIDTRIECFAGVRYLLSGGDILSVRHVEKILSVHPGLVLVNGYGPTENTTFTTCHVMQGPQRFEKAVPIGRPIANTTVRLLDENRRPVGPGEIGELYTGGDGLARGYLRRPELTQACFIQDPFSIDPAHRLYRTGDLAQYRDDGIIEFLGRIDGQIKIRGFRIEPGEIETAMRRLPQVKDAAVCARSAPDGSGMTLVGYVVPHAEVMPSGLMSDIRASLAKDLPNHLIPSHLIPVSQLPITANGKIDRKALPDPFAQQAEPQPSQLERGRKRHTNPSIQHTDVRCHLLQLWEETLHLAPATDETSFVEMGGTSLQALRLLDRVSKALCVEIDIAEFASDPTISGLLRRVARGSQRDRVLPLYKRGDRSPLLFCSGYMDIAHYFPADRPTFALRAPAEEKMDDPRLTFDAIADSVMPEIAAIHGKGVVLGGHCYGAIIALTLARKLEEDGVLVHRVLVIDPPVIPHLMEKPNQQARLRFHAWRILRQSPVSTVRSIRERLRVAKKMRVVDLAKLFADFPQPHLRAPIDLIFARETSLRHIKSRDPRRIIDGWSTTGVKVHDVDGDHISLCREPLVAGLGRVIRTCLSECP